MTTFYITPKKDTAQEDVNDVHSGVSCVQSGDELTVQENKQSITIGCMDIEGCLDVEGQLYIVNLGDI